MTSLLRSHIDLDYLLKYEATRSQILKSQSQGREGEGYSGIQRGSDSGNLALGIYNWFVWEKQLIDGWGRALT